MMRISSFGRWLGDILVTRVQDGGYKEHNFDNHLTGLQII
jgi:hypothetical protein